MNSDEFLINFYYIGRSPIYLNQKEVFSLLENDDNLLKLKTDKNLNTISILQNSEFIEISEFYRENSNNHEFQRIISLFDLFSAICQNRNTKFCLYFIEFFPYNILLIYLKKEELPFEIRASFCRLILVLYLDREPNLYKTKPYLIFKMRKNKSIMRISTGKKFLNLMKNLSPIKISNLYGKFIVEFIIEFIMEFIIKFLIGGISRKISRIYRLFNGFFSYRGIYRLFNGKISGFLKKKILWFFCLLIFLIWGDGKQKRAKTEMPEIEMREQFLLQQIFNEDNEKSEDGNSFFEEQESFLCCFLNLFTFSHYNSPRFPRIKVRNTELPRKHQPDSSFGSDKY